TSSKRDWSSDVCSSDLALGGVPVETTTPDAVAGDAAGDVAVLYLPGGAFVFCGPGTRRRVCGRLAQNLGAPVHSVAYRKLPEVRSEERRVGKGGREYSG